MTKHSSRLIDEFYAKGGTDLQQLIDLLQSYIARIDADDPDRKEAEAAIWYLNKGLGK